MDVESAELKALRGAEKTLRRHKPKLAISMYHKSEDYIEIPRWLNSLNIGYKFWFRAESHCMAETVLYAA